MHWTHIHILELEYDECVPVVLQAQANLQLNFCQFAQVVSTLCGVHALQQLWLQVGYKDGNSRARRVLQGSCTSKEDLSAAVCMPCR